MALETIHPARTSNAWLVIAGAFALFALIGMLFISQFVLSPTKIDTVEARRATMRAETLARLEKESVDKLTTEGWMDKTKGLVHVPVEFAIPTVIAELSAKKPGPSQVKVEPPLPVAAVDPNATEPPPAALPSAPQGADTVHFGMLAAPAKESSALPK